MTRTTIAVGLLIPRHQFAFRYDLCDMTEADVWIRRAARRCQDCVSSENICRQTPKLTIHMYLSRLDEHNWAANLLSIKAFLLTQNLIQAQLWVWSDTVDSVVNANTSSFFEAFSDYVFVKPLVWGEQIRNTPLSEHDYFSNLTQIQSDFGDYPAGYADLVRHILLYRYGGLWIDTDVLLLRDVYPVTIQVRITLASVNWLVTMLLHALIEIAIQRHGA